MLDIKTGKIGKGRKKMALDFWRKGDDTIREEKSKLITDNKELMTRFDLSEDFSREFVDDTSVLEMGDFKDEILSEV